MYSTSGDLASCLTSNEDSVAQCRQAVCEHMDLDARLYQDAQPSSTLDDMK